MDLAGTEEPVLLPLLVAVGSDEVPVAGAVAVVEEPLFGLVAIDDEEGCEEVGGTELGGPAGDEVGLTEGEGETGETPCAFAKPRVRMQLNTAMRTRRLTIAATAKRIEFCMLQQAMSSHPR